MLDVDDFEDDSEGSNKGLSFDDIDALGGELFVNIASDDVSVDVVGGEDNVNVCDSFVASICPATVRTIPMLSRTRIRLPSAK